eukprot:scaffold164510_cov17-Tisochrysis_lutea.AAC.1
MDTQATGWVGCSLASVRKPPKMTVDMQMHLEDGTNRCFSRTGAPFILHLQRGANRGEARAHQSEGCGQGLSVRGLRPWLSIRSSSFRNQRSERYGSFGLSSQGGV